MENTGFLGGSMVANGFSACSSTINKFKSAIFGEPAASPSDDVDEANQRVHNKKADHTSPFSCAHVGCYRVVPDEKNKKNSEKIKFLKEHETAKHDSCFINACVRCKQLWGEDILVMPPTQKQRHCVLPDAFSQLELLLSRNTKKKKDAEKAATSLGGLSSFSTTRMTRSSSSTASSRSSLTVNSNTAAVASLSGIFYFF